MRLIQAVVATPKSLDVPGERDQILATSLYDKMFLQLNYATRGKATKENRKIREAPSILYV